MDISSAPAASIAIAANESTDISHGNTNGTHTPAPPKEEHDPLLLPIPDEGPPDDTLALDAGESAPVTAQESSSDNLAGNVDLGLAPVAAAGDAHDLVQWLPRGGEVQAEASAAAAHSGSPVPQDAPGNAGNPEAVRDAPAVEYSAEALLPAPAMDTELEKLLAQQPLPVV